MDDGKVYKLASLKLAYQKQLYFIAGLIAFTLIGLTLYIINIFKFNFPSFIVGVVIILTGIIGIMTIDQKMKLISKKIKEL